ncbi:hypothetical protein ACR4XJ_12825 [Nitratidesulfovibrio sp. D1]|uniref:hypothetical protein n=1 Tax=Nitratidesulfovibrio sp. D1 TaxID=3440151 RepID=UPI003EBECF17
METRICYSYDSLDFFFNGIEHAHKYPKDPNWSIPAHATLVAPPDEPWPKGLIPVFSATSQEWSLQPDNFWRPTIEEVYLSLAAPLSGVPRLRARSWSDLPRGTLPRLLNGTRTPLWCEAMLAHINILIDDVCETHSLVFSKDLSALTKQPSPRMAHNFAKFHLLLAMKSLIDTVIIARSIAEFGNDIWQEKKLFADSIGNLLNLNDKSDPRCTQLKHELVPTNDIELFLRALNELANAQKHSALTPETLHLVGENSPSILALAVDRNNFNKKITYHNHRLDQIIVGMEMFLDVALSKTK